LCLFNTVFILNLQLVKTKNCNSYIIIGGYGYGGYGGLYGGYGLGYGGFGYGGYGLFGKKK